MKRQPGNPKQGPSQALPTPRSLFLQPSGRGGAKPLKIFHFRGRIFPRQGTSSRFLFVFRTDPNQKSRCFCFMSAPFGLHANCMFCGVNSSLPPPESTMGGFPLNKGGLMWTLPAVGGVVSGALSPKGWALSLEARGTLWGGFS